MKLPAPACIGVTESFGPPARKPVAPELDWSAKVANRPALCVVASPPASSLALHRRFIGASLALLLGIASAGFVGLRIFRSRLAAIAA